MPSQESPLILGPNSSDEYPPIVHRDISALLRPVQMAAPALFMALSRCLTVLHTEDTGEARLSAIAEAENALRLVKKGLNGRHS